MVNNAVVAIVNYNGKILLGKKRKDSSKFLAGQWHLPGETLDDYESDYNALVRGLKEEAGIDIKVGRYLGKSISPTSKRKVNWYECFSKTDNLIPGSDLEEVKLVLKEEVLSYCSKRAIDLWPKEVVNYFKKT